MKYAIPYPGNLKLNDIGQLHPPSFVKAKVICAHFLPPPAFNKEMPHQSTAYGSDVPAMSNLPRPSFGNQKIHNSLLTFERVFRPDPSLL